MESELLRKEQEYRKINEDLETKTKELFQQKIQNETKIDHSSSKYLMRSEFSDDLLLHCTTTLKDVTNTDISESTSNNVNEMGVKGATYFFRTRIKHLERDNGKLYSDFKSKCEELKTAQEELSKLTQEKEKWFHVSNGHKCQISKLENQLSNVNLKLQARENENSILKKERDQLQKELRNETATVENIDAKYKKVIDECQRYKTALKNCNLEEKALRNSNKKQVEELMYTIKKMERHKTEILSAFKKQILLIDNLKKQKGLLEAYRISDKVEADFTDILNWKSD